MDHLDQFADDQPGRVSRRRLFELGGTSALLMAVLAACGGKDDPAPGRVGYAPVPTDPPDEDVDDAVYLRTMTSLEYSIIAMYERFQADSGLEGASAAALERFLADHQANAAQLAELTTAVGGEPYECPNQWYEQRYFEPAMANIFGDDVPATTVPVSDDIVRDTRSMMYALESLMTSSYFRFVELFSTAELRAASATMASQAARRAATTALISNPPPVGYVSPALLAEDGGEVAGTSGTEAPIEGTVAGGEAPIEPVYAITTRFAQLVAVNVVVGAINDLGLRYKTSFETPAENSFVYNSMSC